jgi:hypothetical protein
MGSSLRLDDPSIRDTIARARQERAELANEYHRANAPLVDTSPAPAQVLQQHNVPTAPPAVPSHSGSPLYVASPAPPVHPEAQYPAPARPPHLALPEGYERPAAFQRPTPYARQPVEPAPAVAHA